MRRITFYRSMRIQEANASRCVRFGPTPYLDKFRIENADLLHSDESIAGCREFDRFKIAFIQWNNHLVGAVLYV